MPRKSTKKITKEIAEEVVPAAETKRKPGRPRRVVETAPAEVKSFKKAPKNPPKNPTKKVAAPVVAKGKIYTKAVPAKSLKARVPKPGTKTEVIYKLLTRSKGCTRAEVLEKVGWPSISMQHNAGLLGLKLKLERVGDGTVRYYGNP